MINLTKENPLFTQNPSQIYNELEKICLFNLNECKVVAGRISCSNSFNFFVYKQELIIIFTKDLLHHNITLTIPWFKSLTLEAKFMVLKNKVEKYGRNSLLNKAIDQLSILEEHILESDLKMKL